MSNSPLVTSCTAPVYKYSITLSNPCSLKAMPAHHSIIAAGVVSTTLVKAIRGLSSIGTAAVDSSFMKQGSLSKSECPHTVHVEQQQQ
jgi:hypothetical protein